jgi:hypothetical protein
MQIKTIVTVLFLGRPLDKQSTLNDLEIRGFMHVYERAASY